MQSTTPLAARAFALVRFAFWIQADISSALFPSTTRIESSDTVIRVYDEAGNVSQTQRARGRVQRVLGRLRGVYERLELLRIFMLDHLIALRFKSRRGLPWVRTARDWIHIVCFIGARAMY
jgi:hypothetical protein